MCKSDSKMLFGGLEPLIELSSTLIEQVRHSVTPMSHLGLYKKKLRLPFQLKIYLGR